MGGAFDLFDNPQGGHHVIKRIPVLGNQGEGATRKPGSGDLRLQGFIGRLKAFLLSQVDQHVIRRVPVCGKPLVPGLLDRVRDQGFKKNPVEIQVKKTGPCFLLVISKAVMEGEVEKRQLPHLLQAHGLEGFVAEQPVEHFLFHIGRVEVFLKIGSSHPSGQVFDRVLLFRFEDVGEKEKVFGFLFSPKLDLYGSIGFHGGAVGNDENFSIRLENVARLFDNVVGIFLQVLPGDDPPRPGTQFFHEQDFVNISSQDHEIKGVPRS